MRSVLPRRVALFGMWFIWLVVAGLGMLLALRARSSEVFPWSGAPRTDAQLQQLATPHAFTPITIPLPNGPTLKALQRHAGPQGRWVVLWYGIADDYFEEALAFVNALNLPQGVGVLIPAPRGFAGSEGQPSAVTHDADAREVWQWAQRNLQLRPAATVVIGFSMGAWAALANAEQAPAGLVLLSAFTENDLGRAGPLMRFQAPERVRLFPRSPPTVDALVLHGEDDSGFLPFMGRTLAGWIGARARFNSYPRVDHLGLLSHVPAQRAVSDFLTDRLR